MALVLPVGAVASLAACVSNENALLGTASDGGDDFDSALATFDGSSPIGDAGPGIDSTLPPGDGSAPVADDGGEASTVTQDASFTDALAPSSWSIFNPASLDAGLGSMSGVTFDGRYAYFAPYSSSAPGGIVARLDTQQDFAATGAWTTFATKPSIPGTGGFSGAAFDGEYVYFVPFNNSLSTKADGYDQTFVRYDTHADFATATSWTDFDGTNVASGPFYGATFDGRYVYFTPHFSTYVVWYDTHGAFTSAASWPGFDTATLNPPVPNTGGDVFAGAIFDGTYVYFIGPVVARRDTTALADAGASAWESFGANALGDAGTQVYQCGAFDGRYLYLANHVSDVIAQYDTTLPFTSPSSWTTFDVATAGGGAGGYFSMNFDGRHLYLVPNGAIVATYDTQALFGAASSWTTFDTSALTTLPEGYQTTLFDGQFLYAASSTAGPILRLEVKSAPSALPSLPLFRGSFY